ncbi:unnamed protein product [Brachionus calyciflorus]|uniref:LRAT domain-containing protein n=1 Tax=Brachionus calyciflorus TaxID=104777 RepID=A0A814ENQ9_9BILA|nr:unnamed protein product [Brachionus calyciflorus]
MECSSNQVLSEDENDSFVVINECDLKDYVPVSSAKEVQKFLHNKQVLSELLPGDLIEFKRNLYSHWAIYIGNSKIVHFSGNETRLAISGVQLTEIHKAKINIDNYWDILEDSYAFRNNLFDKILNPLPVEEILIRAYSKVGESNFSIFSNNCEHFAKYCRYGVNSSDQIMKFIKFGNSVTKSFRDLKIKCTNLINFNNDQVQ